MHEHVQERSLFQKTSQSWWTKQSGKCASLICLDLTDPIINWGYQARNSWSHLPAPHFGGEIIVSLTSSALSTVRGQKGPLHCRTQATSDHHVITSDLCIPMSSRRSPRNWQCPWTTANKGPGGHCSESLLSYASHIWSCQWPADLAWEWLRNSSHTSALLLSHLQHEAPAQECIGELWVMYPRVGYFRNHSLCC